MRYLLIVLLSFVLVSCNSTGGTNSASPSQNVNSQVLRNEGTPASDYIETLKSVSEKLKNTPEFNACIQSNISMCVQSSAMQIAQKNKSPEFCEELSSTDQKESCKFAVVMIDLQNNGDIARCDSLSSNFKINCLSQGYRIKAIAEKNVSLCDKIPLPENTSAPMAMNDQSQCVLSVIVSDPESTESDCKQLEDASMRSMCSTSIKQRLITPSISQETTTPTKKKK